MIVRLCCLALALCLVGVPARTPIAAAQAAITIDQLRAEVDFPNSVSFHAHIESATTLQSVVLEYGVEKQTCGTVIAKAFAEVPDATPAEVSWTWEMLQSGSEPPGAVIWYRWRVTDADGNEQVSATERVTWLDSQHKWRNVSSEKLVLHWYEGPQSFADELLAAADAALIDLAATTGVTAEEPIHLYIYGSIDDMREAILYEPGWTGGQAFPAYNSVIIGISPDNLDWGKPITAHELTHVLVGHLTFSCLGSMPTWLNEGIAVYGEGGSPTVALEMLQAAIDADQLISVRALNGQFAEHPDKADLSYVQSFSLVNFLIEQYGTQKLLDLFAAIRDGRPPEAGMRQVYAFGFDELEERWRAAIGAKPASRAAATPTTTPTVVPTYQPPIALFGNGPAGVARPGRAAISAKQLAALAAAGLGIAGMLAIAAGWLIKQRRNR